MSQAIKTYRSISDAFRGSKSKTFTATNTGEVGISETYYAARTRAWRDTVLTREGQVSIKDRALSYDISNEQILCSLDIHGTVQTACIVTGLKPAYEEEAPGVYVNKELISGGPWKFKLHIDTEQGVAEVSHFSPITMELLHDIIPTASFKHKQLEGSILAFAPVGDEGKTRPRAVIYVLRLCNTNGQELLGSVILPEVSNERKRESNAIIGSHEGVGLLDGTVAPDKCWTMPFDLQPNQEIIIPVALVLGESQEHVEKVLRILRAKQPVTWLNETCTYHRNRFGKLDISASPFHAGALVRMAELCRQSIMRLQDGNVAGGFWGSDVNDIPCVWMKDTFYALLPLSMLEPHLCADSILFFTEWGLPPKRWGRGLSRFPDAPAIAHSLSNALSALVLAGAYYQMTGDGTFFKEHPKVYSYAKRALQEVLQTQQADTFLFPSVYISDGVSRGDFHTGSNVVAWYAFHNMARIAAEVYSDKQQSQAWQVVADRIKQDINRYCQGQGPLGQQFFEGAYQAGGFVPGHDGEESDTTLMPFYGFCEADNSALINHARVAFSRYNPYYSPALDGILWGYEPSATTFPGWMTALAGAKTEQELLERLEHIQQLTDLDGSIWWWPHDKSWTDPTKVRRFLGKCAWAAGVYVCKFINDILGARVDVPTRHFSLRPFLPWPEFSWSNCRLGKSCFDLRYSLKENSIAAQVTNGNGIPYETLIELCLPAGSVPISYWVNGKEAFETVRLRTRYSRQSIFSTEDLSPGGSLQLEIKFEHS